MVALEKEQEFEAAKLEARAKVKSATIEISRLQKQISEQEANIRPCVPQLATRK